MSGRVGMSREEAILARIKLSRHFTDRKIIVHPELAKHFKELGLELPDYVVVSEELMCGQTADWCVSDEVPE